MSTALKPKEGVGYEMFGPTSSHNATALRELRCAHCGEGERGRIPKGSKCYVSNAGLAYHKRECRDMFTED